MEYGRYGLYLKQFQSVIFNLIFEKFNVFCILIFQIVECVLLVGLVDMSGIEGCVLLYGCYIVIVVYYINNKIIQV